jgi:hypothetical protein
MRHDAVRMAPGIERRIKPCALSAEQRDEALVREPREHAAWLFRLRMLPGSKSPSRQSRPRRGARLPLRASGQADVARPQRRFSFTRLRIMNFFYDNPITIKKDCRTTQGADAHFISFASNFGWLTMPCQTTA